MAEWWSMDVLDAQERTKGRLGKVLSGELDWSIFRAVPGAGQLDVDIDADTAPEVAWLSDRLRIRHHDGATVTDHGIWLPATPGRKRSGQRSTVTLKLLDKVELLNSPVGTYVTYTAGTVVTDAVVAILAARGETRLLLTPSAATLPGPLTWEPDRTWLQVANDLLTAIGYASLAAGLDGRLRVVPYVAPGDRTVVATYGPPSGRPMIESWTDEASLWEVPTGVRIIVAGNETTPGLIGSADLPATSPWSADSIGRDKLHVEDGEAVDQTTADALAQRRLLDRLQVTRRVTIEHPLDDVEVDQVVTHGPLGVTGNVVARKLRLGLGAVVEDTIRHIYTGGAMPWA